MSRPSSTSTASASANPNAFPQPAGATLLAPDNLRDQLSPARSTFSFASSPKSATFADSGVTFDESKIARPASRNANGDKKGSAPQNYGSRRRTQYYEDQFSYKDDWASSARERVTKDSPIIAELRTNVIIKDEYTLVTDLSHHLSTRYQRPESSIMITVNHSACLLLGGSFEPTYILAITALPTQVQPATNKRNASLIQTFMTETLGVQPDRGIIKFASIPEENLAVNGTTILGDIERLEREQSEDSALKRAMTKSSKRSIVTKAKSSIQLSRGDSRGEGRAMTPQPTPGPFDSGVSVNEKRPQTDSTNSANSKPSSRDTMKDMSVKKKPSSQMRERSGTNKTAKSVTYNIQAPPIPEDGPMPKIGKRKSFIAIFKR
jgi:hypothetical protein